MEKIIRLLVKAVVNLGILLITIVVVYQVGIKTFFYAKDYAGQPDAEEKSSKEVTVVVEPGDTTKDIAEKLKDGGLIESAELFRLQSRFNGYDGKYKQGTFALNTNMTSDEMMEILQLSSADLNKKTITILEGSPIKDIAAYLEGEGLVDAKEFIKISNEWEFDYAFLKDIPQEREYRLEGYLFPDTYYIRDEVDAKELISKMLNRFDEVYGKQVRENGPNGMTMDNIVTIASIIEGEAQLDYERPIVSGVIMNRLNKNIPLQMDATIQYALGERTQRVTYEDLEVDSAYNTYTNTGLPAGPICSPSEASLQAAMKPENHQYIYYVLKGNDGSHFFTENYDEFLSARDSYLKSLEVN